MYIEPNTTIKVYSGIPFDDTYEHTLWFPNISAQNTYFHGGSHPTRAKYVFATNSYQRVERGKMRIERKADDLYDCNYLAFQNTNYGNKWFYAFITGVEYINNVTSEITFKIDSMQTYLFDMELQECFVEREHSATDEIGDNLLPEPIDTSNIICSGYRKTDNMLKYDLIINVARYDDNGTYRYGGLTNGLMQGMTPVRYPLDGDTPLQTDSNVQAILSFLDSLASDNHQDEVISMCMFPSFYAGTAQSTVPVEVPVERLIMPTSFGNYTPKNKKLLTFPYNFIDVDCLSNHALYRYEWFGKTEQGEPYVKFTSVGTTSAQPQIALLPVGYNGQWENTSNFSEKLVMDDFPQVGWSADSFKIWAATHSTSTALKTTGGVASMAGGAVSLMMAGSSAGGVVGGLFGLVAGIMALGNVANDVMVARSLPAQEFGTNTGDIDTATRRKDFYFRFMQITEEQAKTVDDFFSMFGYACNRVKKPARDVRLHWNYVKTKGCHIIGSAPADEIRKVCEIYDRGITFWKDVVNVGIYHNADGTLIDNPPVS